MQGRLSRRASIFGGVAVCLITSAASGCPLFSPLFHVGLVHNLASLRGVAGTPPKFDEFPQDRHIRIGIGRHSVAVSVISNGNN